MFNISQAKSGKLKSKKSSQSNQISLNNNPSLLGKQSQLGNIRFTVGQYWVIIKINGTNYVGNSVNFVMFGKFVGCSEKFWYVGKIFGPLKWYTDRNCFGGGGEGGVGRQN
jgi:hypothetical protein